jgi:hypothetical protein
MKFITMLCPMHEEKTPSFMYNKKTGDFYCFGCGVQGNLFVLHKNRILSEEVLNYIYSHIDKSQMCGDPFTIVDSNMEFNPMLCDECWVPALLDRGKKIQCQNCGKEEECSFENINNFRKYVEKHYADYLRPFTKSL